MSNQFKFELGEHLRDRITGLDGIVTARTQWLHNCNRYIIQPRELDKDGKQRDVAHFDEDQLEPMPKREAYVAKPGTTVSPAHGGPAPVPQRRQDPSRR